MVYQYKGKPNKPQTDKPVEKTVEKKGFKKVEKTGEPAEQEDKKAGISRRDFLLVGGVGATGLVVGGVVGRELLSKKPVAEEIPLPATYISRDYMLCTGCKECIRACSFKHENNYWPAAARITLFQYPPGVEFPVTCYQCDYERCANACPEGALSRDPNTGTPIVDTSKCLRTSKNAECTKCADACPGQAITYHPTSNSPLICDLCGGDPECVKACVNGALTLSGQRGATISPEEIATGLAHLFEVPQPPAEAASLESQSIVSSPFKTQMG